MFSAWFSVVLLCSLPFGAVFTAHFWARLGGIILRLFHRLCWLAHSGFLYVDDMLMLQDAKVLPLSAAALAILCILLQLPISWKKCEFGRTITWIGWQIHILCGFVCIPAEKRARILSLLQKLTSSSHCGKKTLEQFLGLALWIIQIWPHMRTWLHFLYRDLRSIPASQYSVDPGAWEEVCACVSDDLRFIRKPKFTAIPINGHHSGSSYIRADEIRSENLFAFGQASMASHWRPQLLQA